MTVNFDHFRDDRTGLPEVILAGPKTEKDLVEAFKQSIKENTSVLITRIQKHQIETLRSVAKDENINLQFDNYQRTAIIGNISKDMEKHIAILSGGTSDQPIVSEIKFCLEFFGIGSVSYPDVGVAGIHRHKQVLDSLPSTVKIIIVVAGNEGALFSVVSAQTKLPVIAVPVSVGYGFGGKGIASLQSALQSCSPGVVAVNIDNGFGAAAFAKKIVSTYS